MYSTHRPSAGHIDRLVSLLPKHEVVVADSEAGAIKQCEQAKVIVGHRYLRQVMPYVRELQWVQSTAAGVDRLPLKMLADASVRLCQMSIASPTIARHAVTCAWAITRQLPTLFERQQAGGWDATVDWPVMPRRALVVGTGAIGKSIAGLLERESIEVIGVRRTSPAQPVPGFTQTHGFESLCDVLPDCDWCFLAVPLTDLTRNLFDADLLMKMPRSCVLINVARGEIVDIDALCDVMKQGHLAGAALDVLPAEAKATEHPIWYTPRVMITPHVASHCAERPAQIEAFVEHQFERFIESKPLDDEVDI